MPENKVRYTYVGHETTSTGSSDNRRRQPEPDAIQAAAAKADAARAEAAKAAAAAASATVAAGTKAGGMLAGLFERFARWCLVQLTHPRTRTTAVGAVLIIIGALFISHSFWTFPLVLIGIVMIIVAWVGRRLEGRFALEWSDLGAGFEMRARFKAAPEVKMSSPTLPVSIDVDQVVEEDDEPVIEGTAHTVEIDAEELRALVAAADRAVAQQNSRTAEAQVSWRKAVAPKGDGGSDRRAD